MSLLLTKQTIQSLAHTKCELTHITASMRPMHMPLILRLLGYINYTFICPRGQHYRNYTVHTTGLFAVTDQLILIEQQNGNHDLAMDTTLVTEKVAQHLTKCLDSHQINTVIIPIDFTISCHCHEKVEMVQPSTRLYSFNHIFVP